MTSPTYSDSNNPLVWFGRGLSRFADFEGRSRRKAYWHFWLVNLIMLVALTALSHQLGLGFGDRFGLASGALSAIYSVVMLMPGLALTVRRLHDTDHSGFWALFYFVPYIGSFILLFFLLRPGTVGSNRFGADPKQRPFDLAAVDAVFS